MAKNICDNKSIKVRCYSETEEITISQLVDDTHLFLEDLQSLKESIPVGKKNRIDSKMMSTVDVKNESFCNVNCQHQIDINWWHQIVITQ